MSLHLPWLPDELRGTVNALGKKRETEGSMEERSNRPRKMVQPELKAHSGNVARELPQLPAHVASGDTQGTQAISAGSHFCKVRRPDSSLGRRFKEASLPTEKSGGGFEGIRGVELN